MVSTKDQLTDEQRDVVRKVEKLLRLAGKTTSENEAAEASRKANELLLAYNLSVAALGSGSEDTGARAQESHAGGFYDYERELWRHVADLNFCMHWVQSEWVTRTERERNHRRNLERDSWSRDHKKMRSHRLVGRAHNVAATRAMATYLLETTERLTREFVAPGITTGEVSGIVGLGAMLRSRRAVSFREGVVERVVAKIWDRRQEMMAEEQRRLHEERERAAAAGVAGAGSASTAMTISSLRKSEEDANMDAVMGEGWSARRAAERARQAAALREAEEAHTRWAAENPEEARREAERERKEREKQSRRRTGPGSRGGSGGKERDWAAYSAGRTAGASVGIDVQVDRSSQQRITR